GLGPPSLRDVTEGAMFGLKADLGSAGVGTVLESVSFGEENALLAGMAGFRPVGFFLLESP
ncbi:MAG: hypothetical protein WAM11_00705, partial [Cyanobium sp.]